MQPTVATIIICLFMYKCVYIFKTFFSRIILKIVPLSTVMYVKLIR